MPDIFFYCYRTVIPFAVINLQQYHLRCVEVAVKVASDYKWIQPETQALINGCTGLKDDGECRKIDTGIFLAKAWCTNYMASCAEALEISPVGSTVTMPHLLTEYHWQICTDICLNCKRVGHHGLQNFSRRMEKKIDEEISKVMISLVFALAVAVEFDQPIVTFIGPFFGGILTAMLELTSSHS